MMERTLSYGYNNVNVDPKASKEIRLQKIKSKTCRHRQLATVQVTFCKTLCIKIQKVEYGRDTCC